MKDRKRKRGRKADDVEKALYTWFTDARYKQYDFCGYVQSRIMEYPGYCHNMRVDRGYDIKRDLLYYSFLLLFGDVNCVLHNAFT